MANFREMPDDAPDDIQGFGYNRGKYDCSGGYCGGDDCQTCRPGNREHLPECGCEDAPCCGCDQNH